VFEVIEGPVLDERNGTQMVNWAGVYGDTWDFWVSRTYDTDDEDWGGAEWSAQVLVTPGATPITADFEVEDQSTPGILKVYFRIESHQIGLGKFDYDAQYVLTGQDDLTKTFMAGKVGIRQDITQ
jgi:hypothetical protein